MDVFKAIVHHSDVLWTEDTSSTVLCTGQDGNVHQVSTGSMYVSRSQFGVQIHGESSEVLQIQNVDVDVDVASHPVG